MGDNCFNIRFLKQPCLGLNLCTSASLALQITHENISHFCAQVLSYNTVHRLLWTSLLCNIHLDSHNFKNIKKQPVFDMLQVSSYKI